MAYEKNLMKANMVGCVHVPTECPYELRTGQMPDLLKLPTTLLDSVVGRTSR